MEGYNLFLYCANDPVGRIDVSGTDSSKIDDGDILDDEFKCYGKGGGTGSMIGDITYIASKDTKSGNDLTSIWEWLANKLFRKQGTSSTDPSTQKVSNATSVNTVKHTKGTASPKKVTNPNGSYVQMGNNGKIYSYTEYDSTGNQLMRIDFQGRPHAGVLPHIHYFIYPPLGNKKELIFDMNWHQLK